MTSDSIHSMSHFEIRLLKDSLGSVQAELARSMACCKLANEKVSDAMAKLEFLTTLVKNSSTTTGGMGCCSKAQTGIKNDDFATVDEPRASTLTDLDVGNNNNNSSFETANMESESLNVPEENSRRHFGSCKIKTRDDKSDLINSVNESVDSENMDKASIINTVDDLSTIRPKLAKKFRAETKKKIALSVQENGPDPPAMAFSSSEESLSTPTVDVKDCSDMADVNENVVKLLTLTGFETGTIFGSGGRTLQNIESESGASIQVFGNRLDKERKVSIKGEADQVRKAFRMIQDILDVKIKSLTISSAHIGAIIGEKGSRISKLQRTTGATIFIGHGPAYESRERNVTIVGSIGQVREASEMIQKLLRSSVPSVFRV